MDGKGTRFRISLVVVVVVVVTFVAWVDQFILHDECHRCKGMYWFRSSLHCLLGVVVVVVIMALRDSNDKV